MKRRWEIKQPSGQQPVMPEYPSFILKLLQLRGFYTEEEIQDFLNPDYSKLHDPFLFKEMQKAVKRVWDAQERKEKITIYADYDADAITAASVTYLTLKKIGADINCYIPDRFSEGYGMNTEAIKKLQADGTKLIITVDCGTNAVEEALLCRELGMDLIITDHHEKTGPLPDAFALINPKNPSDDYPFPYLTGVGVAFKFVQAMLSFAPTLRSEQSAVPAGWEKWLLDLVAIGTVADCQSLSGENRILVYYGLKVISKTCWIGLKALIKEAQINANKLDTYALGFLIAPRINAAGRIKHADIAFRLLTSENILEAENLAKELNDLNLHRQKLTEQILSEAKAQVELDLSRKVFLVAGDNWPKGIIGLVAGKLCEEFARPVLVLEKGQTVATGSARSTTAFNIVEALGEAKDFLVRYGGHNQAAGFTVTNEQIPYLHQKLISVADRVFGQELPKPMLNIDAEMKEEDISFEIHDYLAKFAPFGMGNPRPKFVAYGFKIVSLRTLGSENQHLKLKVQLGEKVLDVISFRHKFLQNLEPGMTIDLVFELDSNEWQGYKDLQLKLIDLEVKS